MHISQALTYGALPLHRADDQEETAAARTGQLDARGAGLERALNRQVHEDFDDLTMEGLFLPVASLWQVLGAVDDDERLTALGWWGLPEAMLRVWTPSDGAPAD